MAFFGALADTLLSEKGSVGIKEISVYSSGRKGIIHSMKIGEYKALYLMVLPGVLFYLIFHYLPMFGIVIAFQDFKPVLGIKGIFTGEWVGLKNFNRFFQSYYFSRVFVNTISISGLKLICGFPAPILLALLINEIKNMRYKRLVQTFSYLPHFLSWVIVASLIQFILSPTTGFVNEVMSALGMEKTFFLGSPEYFRGVLVLSNIWKDVGWSSIIYLASIASIDECQFEAAIIDGASRFRRIWHITLPSIREVIIILLILNTGQLLNAGFEQIFLLYSPSVYNVADVIDTYVYREGLIKLNYSFATAVGLTKSAFALLLVVTTNKLARQFDAGALW
jgi:putative aldouronate transport system permease protein